VSLTESSEIRSEVEEGLSDQESIWKPASVSMSFIQRASLLKLLTSDPVKRFLVYLDEKELRFRVVEPKVREVAAA